MDRGADPLLAILFEISAVDAEVQDLLRSNPEEAVNALITMMGGHRG